MPPETITAELLPAAGDAPASGTLPDLLDLSEIHGWGQLSPREQKFARGIVAGLSQRAAALAAGCIGDNTAVDVSASRMAAKPTVRMVIAQALHRAGSDLADTITKLTRAQAKAYHDWENAVTREERAAAWKEVREASALLIGLHSRAELRISGAIAHAHGIISPADRSHLLELQKQITVPEAALDALALARREVLVARRDGVLPPPGASKPAEETAAA